jgi:glycosyltransferase involved in cell wall biosynthesis
MAECFATGIPVISSFNIGDVDEIINDLKAGMLVNPLLDSDLLNAINNINSIKENGGKRLRNISRPLFGLEVANKRYMSVYEAIKHRGVN